MATDKRARQRANRQAKIEQELKGEQQAQMRRRVFIGVMAAVALIAGLFLLQILSGDDEADEAEADNAEVEAGTEDAEGDEASTDEDAADDAEEAEASDEASDVLALPADADPALTDPSLATETAPDTFKAKFETTKGDFVVQVNRDWAPNGADRFYNLVNIGFYDQAGFFRTIEGFMAQFGISAYPEVSTQWREAQIDDDPVVESNTRGKVTFATGGPNTRTTQLFINFGDNSNLDGQGFSPFGEVIEGMDIVDSLHITGEGQPSGPGPSQGEMQSLGTSYLQANYPDADIIQSVTIVE